MGSRFPTRTVNLEGHDAVVFDLDGTLVRLAVDWTAVDSEVSEIVSVVGVDPTGRRAWDLYDEAVAAGVGDAVEERIAAHERAGAVDAERLSLAERLPLSVPVAVCSLNCEAAVRRALAAHGLADHVQAVVGRDTVGARKPDPEPLLDACRRLGADPAGTLFVGDSERDEETAQRAGVSFAYVGDGPTDY
jgi:HAD superfamily hydrolase (TIGR01509 family)